MSIPEHIENVCLADAYIEKNTLYAAGFEHNIFLEWDMESAEIKWAQKFESFKSTMSFVNMAIFEFEGKIFCFSRNSYEIAEVDPKKKEFRYYHPERIVEQWDLIKLICRVGNEVWLFESPLCSTVTVFSMEKKKYFQYNFSIEGKEQMNDLVPVSIENSICIEDQIWRCVPGTSKVLIFDTKSKKAYVKKTGLPISAKIMNYCEGLLYILAFDGKYIATLNPYTYESYVYETGYTGKSSRPFREVAKIGKHIFLLPCFEERIFCYEINEAGLSLIKHIEFPKEFKKIHDIEHRTMFWRWKKVSNHLFLLPFAGNGMLCIELNSLAIAYYPIKITEQYYLTEMLRTNVIINENQMNLDNYINAIKYENDQEDSNFEKKNVKIGKCIWNELR